MNVVYYEGIKIEVWRVESLWENLQSSEKVTLCEHSQLVERKEENSNKSPVIIFLSKNRLSTWDILFQVTRK